MKNVTEKRAAILIRLLERMIRFRVTNDLNPGYFDRLPKLDVEIQSSSYWEAHMQRVCAGDSGVTQILPFEALASWHELQNLKALYALIQEDLGYDATAADSIVTIWFAQLLKVVYGRRYVSFIREGSHFTVDDGGRVVRVWMYSLTIHSNGCCAHGLDCLVMGSSTDERFALPKVVRPHPFRSDLGKAA